MDKTLNKLHYNGKLGITGKKIRALHPEFKVKDINEW
jgi:hypothetical protein